MVLLSPVRLVAHHGDRTLLRVAVGRIYVAHYREHTLLRVVVGVIMLSGVPFHLLPTM